MYFIWKSKNNFKPANTKTIDWLIWTTSGVSVRSEKFVELFWLVVHLFVLDQNVKLILRLLATPILLKDSLGEFISGDDFISSFFFIEVASFPDIHLVLVVFMAWYINLGTDTQDQKLIFLEIFEIKDSSRLIPVRISVKSWFHFLLLFHDVSVVCHLVYQRSLLDVVDGCQIN